MAQTNSKMIISEINTYLKERLYLNVSCFATFPESSFFNISSQKSVFPSGPQDLNGWQT